VDDRVAGEVELAEIRFVIEVRSRSGVDQVEPSSVRKFLAPEKLVVLPKGLAAAVGITSARIFSDIVGNINPWIAYSLFLSTNAAGDGRAAEYSSAMHCTRKTFRFYK